MAPVIASRPPRSRWCDRAVPVIHGPETSVSVSSTLAVPEMVGVDVVKVSGITVAVAALVIVIVGEPTLVPVS